MRLDKRVCSPAIGEGWTPAEGCGLWAPQGWRAGAEGVQRLVRRYKVVGRSWGAMLTASPNATSPTPTALPIHWPCRMDFSA